MLLQFKFWNMKQMKGESYINFFPYMEKLIFEKGYHTMKSNLLLANCRLFCVNNGL